jgi:hypothetical protein
LGDARQARPSASRSSSLRFYFERASQALNLCEQQSPTVRLWAEQILWAAGSSAQLVRVQTDDAERFASDDDAPRNAE